LKIREHVFVDKFRRNTRFKLTYMTTANTKRLGLNKPELRLDSWLLVLLIIAFILRIWGIWNATSQDEYNEVFEALRVCSGNLNFERWFKRFYLYILTVEYGVYYVIGWIFNLFQSPNDFAVKILRDPYPLFMLGRITSAVLGTGSVFLTYLVGRQLYSRSVGLIAALFLCFNVVNVELSHYARVDACLGFVVMAAFYWIAKVTFDDRQSLLWYIFAGILSGIAFQNKMQAVVLLFPFAFAHFSRFPWKEFRKALFTKAVFVFSMSYLLGLVIGNPAVIFAPVSFVNGLVSWGSGAYTTPVNETVGTIGYIAYFQYFYKELGIPQALLALVSLALALFHRQKRDLLLLSFILPFYGLMGASKYLVSYSYMIPLMPFLYLLMARTLNDNLNWFPGFSSRKQLVTTVTLMVLLVYPLVKVGGLEQSFAGKNTRVLAKEWIEENIPFGSKILMDSGKTINSFAPLIAENEVSIRRTLDRKRNEIETNTLNDPTKMVDSSSMKYFEMLLQTVPLESYDITSTQFGLAVKNIDYYLINSYQYIIASDGMMRTRTAESFSKRHPEITLYYLSLQKDARLSLIVKIKPTVINRGQPFYIYQLIP